MMSRKFTTGWVYWTLIENFWFANWAAGRSNLTYFWTSTHGLILQLGECMERAIQCQVYLGKLLHKSYSIYVTAS